MPSELETAREELKQLISDRDLPHILEKRVERLKSHITEHETAIATLNEQLTTTLYRQSNLEHLIESCHDRIRELEERHRKSLVAPAEAKAADLLSKLSPAERAALEAMLKVGHS